MLEQNLVVFRNQQAGDRVAREIFSQGWWLSMIVISNVGRRTFEGPWRSGTLDPPRRINLVKMAEYTDAIFWFVRVALQDGFEKARYREALNRSVEFSVWACRGEDRLGASLSISGIWNWLGGGITSESDVRRASG
ncbi:hypothetical protein [Bradyrhizobium sp.]|uniref:hypothetical protein n=1 Tax=Bradyrhizobium sp. TaxID=376 RepID=UPI003C6F9CEE